ncbi:MAG: hypothetical protein GQ475_05815 [Methylococcaceae bacterium]|nr:hypothetical protein [Methylococcaceae bacterium]
MVSIENQQAKSFWLDHIRQWNQSELSQAAYCRQHDLCEQKFSYRKRQSTFAKKATTSSAGFTRVQVDSSIQSSTSDVGLSIRFSNDIRIEGISESNLTLIPQLLTVLR